MYEIKEKYVDFLGNDREETFRFNISETELTKMQLSKNGGFDSYVRRIIDAQDQATLMGIFDKIIEMSYGIISDDGKRFIKNDEIINDFKSTNAYNQIYMRLISDSKFSADFVNNVFPKRVIDEAIKSGEMPKEYIQSKSDSTDNK